MSTAAVAEEISSARTFHGADARVAFHAWRTARIADSSFFGPLSGRSRVAASWNAWNAFGPGQKQESERALLCSLAADSYDDYSRNVVQ